MSTDPETVAQLKANPAAFHEPQDGDQYQNLTIEEMRTFVRRHEWTFAKSMPQIPHEYLLEWNADKADDYFRFVMTIRRLGYDDYFFNTKYRYADVDGFKYWTMGEYLNTTCVLNRAKLDRPENPLTPNPVPFVPSSPSPPRRLFPERGSVSRSTPLQIAFRFHETLLGWRSRCGSQTRAPSANIAAGDS